ncbi:MAG: thiamine phosphate synthase [Planctomycetota bacterium]|nr:thiamine phosphate synthase [Planctomycetota bacterium]
MCPDSDQIRERLERSHLMLLFTPELCLERDPLSVLDAVLSEVDIVQVRPKAAGAKTPCEARATFDWAEQILALVASRRLDTLVLVDDRVDVARALWDRGCAGVHVGADDMPIDEARTFLGPGPLIGLSTHSLADVIDAEEARVDYLGFGPIRATTTKGYVRGIGIEEAWVAASASARPLFAIGGIDHDTAADLARVGRAAVASAILSASDPARVARELRALLTSDAD